MTPNLEKRLGSIVANHSADPKAKWSESADLKDHLGFDSLDVIACLIDIEEEFGVEISDDEIKTVKTVGDLARLVRRKTT